MSNEVDVSRPRKKARRKTLPLVGVLFLALVFGGAGWAASAYVTLVRLHVGIVDACDRVETAGRVQLELVDNLLLVPGAFDPLEEERLAAVRAARDRAGEAALAPEMLADDARLEEFRAAHDDLNASIEALWKAADRLGSDAARLVVADLAPGLRRAQSHLLSDLESVDRRAEAYERATARFPGSVVAAYATAEGLPGERSVRGL